MIPFAGYEPTDKLRQFGKQATAYELFQLGLDTARIAQRLGITEAKALKLVTLERSAILHKPSPYGV